MTLPEIVYLQTTTACDGHCRYCPFDDVYPLAAEGFIAEEMSAMVFGYLVLSLEAWGYRGRIGFLLHCEPTLDPMLAARIAVLRAKLPKCRIEIATNGLYPGAEALRFADEVVVVPAGSRRWATTRAGNVRDCLEVRVESAERDLAFPQPCTLPEKTLCVAVDGSVLLCCQDWRHEAVVGHVSDLDAARRRQLSLVGKVRRLELAFCRDCHAERTAEEVGERLGKRRLPEVEG